MTSSSCRLKCPLVWARKEGSACCSYFLYNFSSQTYFVCVARGVVVPPQKRRFHPFSELYTLCTKLGVPCFKDKEYQFLHEYCTAMKPLTAVLDILQGDCPYGTLLPTLEVLMQKTLAVKDTLSRMTAGLQNNIMQVCSIFKPVKMSCIITLFIYMEQNIQYHYKKRLKQTQNVSK